MARSGNRETCDGKVLRSMWFALERYGVVLRRVRSKSSRGGRRAVPDSHTRSDAVYAGAANHTRSAARGGHAGGFRLHAGRFVLERGGALRGRDRGVYLAALRPNPSATNTANAIGAAC